MLDFEKNIRLKELEPRDIVRRNDDVIQVIDK